MDTTHGVVETFRREFAESPTVLSRAPGRVNLVGGHVDYNDGIVLPAAIDRATVVAARPRADDTIRVHSARMDETVTARVGDPRDDWAAYVVGTATVLDGDVGADDSDVLGADESTISAVRVRNSRTPVGAPRTRRWGWPAGLWTSSPAHWGKRVTRSGSTAGPETCGRSRLTTPLFW
jgi:hypothetical protein